ncbi:tyrosine-type recombinase/integrase [Microbispora sp. NBRC 16548]|uniref:tyrosine-type recombinase/integrase n=1 Tax=Microbispora sp. NBRC 16548 TaxID=3030994 RepID=UPI0025556DFF|nr:tyrosine-type recombinase/integrase [Microbispora sp. NBRC 16548]
MPLDRMSDRVLSETAYVCGARASKVCRLYVEDLDLRLDDQHMRIHGKGGSVRAVLLNDRGHTTLLMLYLARVGYTAGPLSRADQPAGRCPMTTRSPTPRSAPPAAAATGRRAGTYTRANNERPNEINFSPNLRPWHSARRSPRSRSAPARGVV